MRRFGFPAFAVFTLFLVPLAGSAQKLPPPDEGLRTGMTWTVLEQIKGFVHVGSDARTNPYTGDTAVDQFLPILCVHVDGQAPPVGIPFGFYDGWLQGQVQATPAIAAVVLTSKEQGNLICADTFGAGWRLAEFHDGRYGADFSLSGGWSFWGSGALPAGTRFWVAIDDQPANPWNSAGVLPASVPTPKFVVSEAPVPGQYLALFPEDSPEDGVDALAKSLAAAYGVTILDVFSAVQGFSFEGSEAQARAMSEDPQVETVEQDTYGQPAELWHLDRVDQRSLPLDDLNYTPPNDGSGVNVYILDTGFRRSHQEFGGRARQDADFIRFLGSHDDCDGHGTAVGSLAGGSTVGVARGATLISIRVAGCKGNAYNPLISVFHSTIVAGLDWVARYHQSPAVANVSYGFPPGFWRRWLNLPSPMDRAVKRAVKAGIAVTVAAGNEGKDVKGWSSPARAAEAISVSATDRNDRRPDGANYGKVDLFAPGVDQLVAALDGDAAYKVGSGTSYSAPMAAGAAALYLHDNPTATPAQVRNALEGTATPGVVRNPGSGSANRLLFVGRTADVGVIPEAGATCPGETVQFQMDDEDRNNANGRSGWLGRIQSSNNTIYTFCRVNGTNFHPLVTGAPASQGSYAVLKLGAVCPAGAVDYSRHYDNEDNRNANWVSGGIFPNFIDNNSTLSWCVFRPAAGGTPFAFPNLGFAYGVLAPTFPLALATGWIYQDDEDNRNDDWYLDASLAPPLYSIASPIPELITGDHNTQTFLAKVR